VFFCVRDLGLDRVQIALVYPQAPREQQILVHLDPYGRPVGTELHGPFLTVEAAGEHLRAGDSKRAGDLIAGARLVKHRRGTTEFVLA
jgi:hypothetical protein